MKIASFSCCTNGNLRLFEPNDEYSNNITDDFLEQGFSWRPGSVAFYTIDNLGMDVDVFLNDTVKLSINTMRSIQVPYCVESNQGVAVDSGIQLVDVLNISSYYRGILESCLPVPSGNYALTFAQGFYPGWDVKGYSGLDEEANEGKSTWVHIWFVATENVEPKILVDGFPDPYLTLKKTYPLLMNAQPFI